MLASLWNGFLLVPDPEDPDPHFTASGLDGVSRPPHLSYKEPVIWAGMREHGDPPG
ncbi:MAG TPA: hypothetical protein VF635_10645 [Propionibacteriaceae bacterium]